MTLDLDIGRSTRLGRRFSNEDFAAFACVPAHGAAARFIAAIADGVSSGGGGLEAAQASVLGLMADYPSAPETWHTSVVLDRLISAQNTWLADHNRRRQGVHATGSTALALTTLTAIVLRGRAWTVAHVGDTRAWLLRDGNLAQLTADHAFDEEFQRSRLTRAIGLDDAVRIDFEQGELRRGDVLVLTSDGVHGVLPRARLQELAGHADARAASRHLVDAAERAGTRDNATALVIRVRGLGEGTFEDALLPGRDLPLPRLLAAGDRLDDYVIEAVAADTGAHLVYRARRAAGGEVMAIKTLHPARAADLTARAALLHEAWLAERVAADRPPAGEAALVGAHPRDGASALYTVFDWQDGRPLGQLLAQGRRFEVDEVVAGVLSAARALARLHRLGVIHRDVKPDNLLLRGDGRWVLMDLGAALAGSDAPHGCDVRAGTPSYMNPEQWDDAAGGRPMLADESSDVFALGVVLYEWLTAKLPYGDVEPFQRGRFRRDPRPPSRLRPDIPVWLDDVVLRAVAIERARRFDTAEELVVALERAAARPAGPRHATPLATRDPGVLLGIALCVSLLFNALLVYWMLFLPR